MYKLLLAEDEPPIMRAVKKTFESAGGDIWDIQTAINGRQARQMLEKEDFDVVVTDIKMPLMTGIELAQWIHENRPELTVVILSGYSDFEYTRKALEYKVFDYLLKPTSLSAVAELTEKLKKELAPKQAQKKLRDSTAAVMLACAGAYLLFGAEVMMPGALFWSDEKIENYMKNELREGEEYIFFNESSQSERYVVIQSDDEARRREIIENFYAAMADSSLPVTVIYNTSITFKNSAEYFQKLRQQLVKRLILGTSQLIDMNDCKNSYSEISRPYTLEDIEKTVTLIRNGDADKLRSVVCALFNKMRAANSTQEELNDMLNVILDTYVLKNPADVQRRNISVKHEFVNSLAGFLSYDELTDDITSILLTLRDDRKNEDRYEKLANEVEAYLIMNYRQSITSETLALRFNFVQSYISRIFKRQKGVSPNEFLTHYRMEIAKRYLREQPDMKIRELAPLVGVKDSYYFSKMFKKETGMWPTEYANRG